MKIFKQRKIITIVIIILVVLAGYLRFHARSAKQVTKINLKKAVTTTVKRGYIQKDLTLAGKVDSYSYAVLQFQTSGKLAWVGIKEGERVKKWQAIASLDKTDLEKRMKKTLNDYLTNRWNFEDTQDQYQEIKENFLLTGEIKRILERKQFSLDNAVLDVQIADLAIKYATLISPINGIVTQIDQPVAGVNIIPSTATFTVIDPESIYFKSEIDEEDVTGVNLGQSTIITLDSYPDNPIQSKIDNISFVPVQGQTATVYKIKFNLPVKNNNLTFRIGMNGEAKIKLAEAKNVLMLPLEAVFEEKGEKFVYLKKGKGTPEKRLIKTGLENDSSVEITDGLAENEIVIYSD